ncbi:MAG: dTDP-4-amino-4,6-dideoxygalactose transaminase [Dorea sp.]|jgi:dTDP-4-amino-4,6-dideoxygalactose transaminase|nr:dTDP-4-amino-4,6-dideoxygalactose transaminase [Dorea sp.]
MIPFNKAPYFVQAENYVIEALKYGRIAGDGKYTKLCTEWMEKRFHAKKILLTTSCTSALEMSAILLDIKSGDEVIMPSYTFVTTANAFVLRGAKIVFVDIRPDTMNIDEEKIEAAISENTKAIVVVHYAGVSCNMEQITKLAEKYDLPVVEDAAQGVMADYNGKALGTLGTLGCYSFHETKNYTMGEGGALVINDERYIERAEILREKGTNRTRFFRGMIDKYSWVDLGSSYLPSEINAAILYAQLERADEINDSRLHIWNQYYENLKEVPVDLPQISSGCNHNAHMFYIKTDNLLERKKMLDHLIKNNIGAVFHYVPLHSSKAGVQYGRFCGEDKYTTIESERLLRLPLWYGLTDRHIRMISETIKDYYR